MNIFNMKSLHDAKAIVLSKDNTIELKSESVHLLNSHGRIVSETIYAQVDIPAFNRSTVDGYAVKVKDILGASDSIPSILTPKSEVLMGEAATMVVTWVKRSMYQPVACYRKAQMVWL